MYISSQNCEYKVYDHMQADILFPLNWPEKRALICWLDFRIWACNDKVEGQ